ncbi:MAG TPA: SAM-dependent chlorinase/fluorinase [Bacteroidota bacterium]|nr:SAM-dependent chlorinase/fluorinase [Bacteroidota bacterium]
MKKPSLIALLTDFGDTDAYVASMKAVILSIAPTASIVDITHNIPPQEVRQASYQLWTVYKYFPKGTIFLCVVDPEVGSLRKIICVESDDHIFLAPDNGLLTYVLRYCKVLRVVEVLNSKYFQPTISSTFHGRDIFAPVAAHLSKLMDISNLGPGTQPKLLNLDFIELSPRATGKYNGRIIHIDHFGNIVTNILFKRQPTKSLRLKINRSTINSFYCTYSDAPANCSFMIMGSTNLLEVSLKNGNASTELRVKVGQKVLLEIK